MSSSNLKLVDAVTLAALDDLYFLLAISTPADREDSWKRWPRYSLNKEFKTMWDASPENSNEALHASRALTVFHARLMTDLLDRQGAEQLYQSWMRYITGISVTIRVEESASAATAGTSRNRLTAVESLSTASEALAGLDVVRLPFRAAPGHASASMSALSPDCFVPTGQPDEYLLLLGPGSRMRRSCRSCAGAKITIKDRLVLEPSIVNEGVEPGGEVFAYIQGATSAGTQACSSPTHGLPPQTPTTSMDSTLSSSYRPRSRPQSATQATFSASMASGGSSTADASSIAPYSPTSTTGLPENDERERQRLKQEAVRDAGGAVKNKRQASLDSSWTVSAGHPPMAAEKTSMSDMPAKRARTEWDRAVERSPTSPPPKAGPSTHAGSSLNARAPVSIQTAMASSETGSTQDGAYSAVEQHDTQQIIPAGHPNLVSPIPSDLDELESRSDSGKGTSELSDDEEEELVEKKNAGPVVEHRAEATSLEMDDQNSVLPAKYRLTITASPEVGSEHGKSPAKCQFPVEDPDLTLVEEQDKGDSYPNSTEAGDHRADAGISAAAQVRQLERRMMLDRHTTTQLVRAFERIFPDDKLALNCQMFLDKAQAIIDAAVAEDSDIDLDSVKEMLDTRLPTLVDPYTDSLAQKDETIASLRVELDDTRIQHMSAFRASQIQMVALRDREAKLLEQVREAERTIAVAKTNTDTADKAATDAQAAWDLGQGELKEALARSSDLASRVTELEEQAHKASDTAASLEKQLAAARAEARSNLLDSARNSEIARVRSEMIHTLQKQRDNFKQRITDLEIEANAAKRDRDMAQNALAHRNARIQELKAEHAAEIAKRDSSFETARQRIQELESIVQARPTHAQHSEALEQLDAAQIRLLELERDLQEEKRAEFFESVYMANKDRQEETPIKQEQLTPPPGTPISQSPTPGELNELTDPDSIANLPTLRPDAMPSPTAEPSNPVSFPASADRTPQPPARESPSARSLQTTEHPHPDQDTAAAPSLAGTPHSRAQSQIPRQPSPQLHMHDQLKLRSTPDNISPAGSPGSAGAAHALMSLQGHAQTGTAPRAPALRQQTPYTGSPLGRTAPPPIIIPEPSPVTAMASEGQPTPPYTAIRTPHSAPLPQRGATSMVDSPGRQVQQQPLRLQQQHHQRQRNPHTTIKSQIQQPGLQLPQQHQQQQPHQQPTAMLQGPPQGPQYDQVAPQQRQTRMMQGRPPHPQNNQMPPQEQPMTMMQGVPTNSSHPQRPAQRHPILNVYRQAQEDAHLNRVHHQAPVASPAHVRRAPATLQEYARDYVAHQLHIHTEAEGAAIVQAFMQKVAAQQPEVAFQPIAVQQPAAPQFTMQSLDGQQIAQHAQRSFAMPAQQQGQPHAGPGQLLSGMPLPPPAMTGQQPVPPWTAPAQPASALRFPPPRPHPPL